MYLFTGCALSPHSGAFVTNLLRQLAGHAAARASGYRYSKKHTPRTRTTIFFVQFMDGH